MVGIIQAAISLDFDFLFASVYLNALIKSTRIPKRYVGYTLPLFALDPSKIRYQVYSGLPYQRGAGIGNVFRGLIRFLLPVAKTVGKSLGKQALRTGAQIASDLAEGRDLEGTVKARGVQAIKAMGKKGKTKKKKVAQKGKGLGSRPKAINKTRKKGKATKLGKKKQRKRMVDSLGIYYR